MGTVCRELCKNGWTDRDAVWVVESGGSKEERVTWGAQCSHLANTTGPSVCGGDAIFCQITLTTCYFVVPWGRLSWLTSAFERMQIGYTPWVEKGCHPNNGYNFVNSWSICKILSLLQRAVNFQQIRNFALFMHVKRFKCEFVSSIRQISVKYHENKCKE